jgi:hypothetical protein
VPGFRASEDSFELRAILEGSIWLHRVRLCGIGEALGRRFDLPFLDVGAEGESFEVAEGFDDKRVGTYGEEPC